MKLTYYGHACFEVETSGKRLLFDPFIRPNPLAAAVKVTVLKPDFILVSHGHFDHLSEAVELARATGALVISNYEVSEWLAKQGAPRVHGMNLGGTVRLDFGRVKFVVAQHSSTLPDGAPGGNPGGFVVEAPEGAFYYSGDSALTYDMKLIAEGFDLRFAVLPIGDNFTMGVDDAIKAADFVGCRRVVGVHYNTFPPIAIDTAEAVRKFAAAGKELLLPAIGQSVSC